jgi:hypothetical protein
VVILAGRSVNRLAMAGIKGLQKRSENSAHCERVW